MPQGILFGLILSIYYAIATFITLTFTSLLYLLKNASSMLASLLLLTPAPRTLHIIWLTPAPQQGALRKRPSQQRLHNKILHNKGLHYINAKTYLIKDLTPLPSPGYTDEADKAGRAMPWG